MASANQTDENFFEMYKRLIAEKNAENEALKANLEKEKAANDRMEREYAGLELKIALNEKKGKEHERKIYKRMVSINSRIDFATRLNNAKIMEIVICAESEFSKEAKAQSAKFAQDTNVKALENKLKTLQIINSHQMDAIQKITVRIADTDAYETGFDDEMRKIDVATTAKLEQLDILIATEQKRNARLHYTQMLAEREIVATDANTPNNYFLLHFAEPE